MLRSRTCHHHHKGVRHFSAPPNSQYVAHTVGGCARAQLAPNRVGSHTAAAEQRCPAWRSLFLRHPCFAPLIPGPDGKGEQ